MTVGMILRQPPALHFTPN